jgi:hypothetical protein
MSRGDITLAGLNGKVHVEIKRLSHEELLLQISSSKYEVSEKLVVKNEELEAAFQNPLSGSSPQPLRELTR